ncbi:MAG: sigma-70 family RNA polymerase sigma factor [Gammaproteobacteria bacterium]|nr:sigma-70 family RNA polymerase sigma factor [Gammaproteobacteria bacterium]
MNTALGRPETSDAEVLGLLRRGAREQAFARVLEGYEQKVFRLCCALLGERTQAEDAAQESLLRVWHALERYDGRAGLSSWIYAITRNRCLSALARRRTFDSLDAPEWGEHSLEPTADEVLPDASDGRVQQLRDLVELLPERQRQVLRLYYFEDRSVSEVALMLGCPEGTVKTGLFRARAALAALLERRGLADPSYWQEMTS